MAVQNREGFSEAVGKAYLQSCTASFQTCVSDCCSDRLCSSPGSPTGSVRDQIKPVISALQTHTATRAGEVLILSHPMRAGWDNEWLGSHSLRQSTSERTGDRWGRYREIEPEKEINRYVGVRMYALKRTLAVCRTGVLPARPWPIPSSSDIKVEVWDGPRDRAGAVCAIKHWGSQG